MKLDKIKSALKSILSSFASVSTDKGVLVYDGDEIAEGVSVKILDTETDTEIDAEDGDYYLGDEDGRTLTVEGGVITAIKEKEEEQEDEQEDEPAEEISAEKVLFNSVKAAFEESYEEKEQQIIAAIRSKGYEDSWLVEAGDDFAVIQVWSEEKMDYVHYRFSISWSEDGEVIIGEAEEVKPAFVPAAEDVEKEAEEVEESERQQYESQISELKARIEELENKPADKSAKDKFNTDKKIETETDRKFANLMRYCK